MRLSLSTSGEETVIRFGVVNVGDARAFVKLFDNSHEKYLLCGYGMTLLAGDWTVTRNKCLIYKTVLLDIGWLIIKLLYLNR